MVTSLFKRAALVIALCSLATLAWAASGVGTSSSDATLVKTLLHDPHSPYAGNKRGNVTVVEFFDYQCSHCIAMAPTIANIIHSDKNVRVVFKEFPIRGPASELAARAALAANLQGKYMVFSHALLTANTLLSEQAILNIAKQVGLNTEKLQKDMQLKSIKQDLRTNYALAEQLKLPGTPAFFVGKTDATSIASLKYLPGEVSQSDLQNAINGV